MRLVYATYPSLALAEAAARQMVEARLAACANILPGMVSIFQWEGRTERAEEVVVLFKTAFEQAEAVVEAVRAGHPYEVPAVFILPVEGGLPAFLGWVDSETGHG
ncbi:divalent-cation tolerance protein CutA [Xanthobacteraceae bacterium A53D]